MPVTSITETVFQVFTMGIFRLAAVVFHYNCDKTIKKCALERQSNKKSS